MVIAERTSTFVACQCCKFLQGMIASTPRSYGEVLDALKQRLGRHYAFQASQRLADERLMEQARRSDQAEWHLQVDKMDQTKTNLPCIHSLWL